MANNLTYWDFEDAAKEIGCSVAMIKAFALTESGGRGGFDDEGRLLIRYEGHKFREYTDHRFDAEYPKVSYRYHKSHRGCGKFHSYDGFNIAFGLRQRAALLSCSLGMFQQMGFNYAEMGYDSVDAMWDDFRTGERAQLMAFVRLIKKWGLADEMRAPSLKNCRALAKRYNGEDYEANDYHNKIFNAYKKFSKEKKPTGARPLIIGAVVPVPILETVVAAADIENAVENLGENISAQAEEFTGNAADKIEDAAEQATSGVGGFVESAKEEARGKINDAVNQATNEAKTRAMDAVTQTLPNFTKTARWLKSLSFGGILSFVFAYFEGLPWYVQLLTGYLAGVATSALVFFLLYKTHKIAIITEKATEANANPLLNNIRLVQLPPAPGALTRIYNRLFRRECADLSLNL